MPAPEAIISLVRRFDEHVDAYKSGTYNETQLRRDFLDPFFEALGWDMHNKQGYAEGYRDVIHEDRLSIFGAVRAPDYGFRVGGQRKFFVEAKKPSVRIKVDVSPAYQLRRYAWSAKLPLSVLTDFEEFAVYDCRFKPESDDPASRARVAYFTYRDYEEKWDWIASIFSREAILKGSFDKYAAASRAKRGTAEVDEDFLATIEEWRKDLARNIALRNHDLTQRELNFCVQRILDRIIFLRICEDRGIEDYQRLLSVLEGKGLVYARLCRLFQRADERYNSGLFHFKEDKGRREQPDLLTSDLTIDDALLKSIVRGLYYPESPYEFRVLGADILGQIYERFLGNVIRLTSGHRAVVEEKPAVRKAGGVYYTPTYVVEYTVRSTLGGIFEGKTPRQVPEVKVLDPACGSGSFLIGAYQFLLDWYHGWYTANEAERWAKGKSPALVRVMGGWTLTVAERQRILLAHIFGVDIDAQAVEVTKLSLLLKVLEGETSQSLQQELILQRVLPDLGNNIKCGNSLIDSTFAAGLAENEASRINTFDWAGRDGFPAIVKSGGFDAILGNPPWGAEFSEIELQHLRVRYSDVVARMVDSYIYFIARSSELVKAGRPIGFVVPSTVLNQSDARPVRELLLARGLTHLVNLGQGVFGAKVLNTSTIFVSAVVPKLAQLHVQDMSRVSSAEKPYAFVDSQGMAWSVWSERVRTDPHLTFFVGDDSHARLLERLRNEHPPLAEVLVDGIARGVSPDIAAAHVLANDEASRLRIEAPLLRKSVSGTQIKRYRPWASDQMIIYTTKDTLIDKYPRALAYLSQFEGDNSCPEVREGKHPYWTLHRPRDPAIFADAKFIGLTTARTIELIYDEGGELTVTDAMYVFKARPGIDPWVLMAVLQSRVFLALYRISNQGDSRVIPQIKASKLEPLPVPAGLAAAGKSKAVRERIRGHVLELRKLYERRARAKAPHDRDLADRQIAGLDEQIEREVAGLYGLTGDELGIVNSLTTMPP